VATTTRKGVTMKRILNAIVAVALVSTASSAFAEEEHHAGQRAGAAVDRAGEKVDRTAHKTKKKVKNAARRVKENVRADDRGEDRAERVK
jgi:ribosome-associated translation inhibitor RaiA